MRYHASNRKLNMAKEAGTKALADAGISYKEVEQTVVGYVYGIFFNKKNIMFIHVSSVC